MYETKIDNILSLPLILLQHLNQTQNSLNDDEEKYI